LIEHAETAFKVAACPISGQQPVLYSNFNYVCVRSFVLPGAPALGRFSDSHLALVWHSIFDEFGWEALGVRDLGSNFSVGQLLASFGEMIRSNVFSGD
jgi:hypothetical protein